LGKRVAMKVCVQKLLLVFLVSVQGSGVTEDFEADCTITDNIKKIVRRLRLSSSKPFRQDMEVNLFGSEGGEDVKSGLKITKLKSEKQVKIERNKITHQVKRKASTKVTNLPKGEHKLSNESSLALKQIKKQDKDSKHLKVEKPSNVSSNKKSRIELQERKSIPALVDIKIPTKLEPDSRPYLKINSTGNQLEVSNLITGNVVENKCIIMYSEKETEEYKDKLKQNYKLLSKSKTLAMSVVIPLKNNKTNPSPLKLGSCTYIDLTVVQSKCGPGYKAMVEKQDPGHHHSIFFDNTSGNIIYAVHRENRWQCCKSSRNLTLDVRCTLGARCAG